jgi:hypothetical protein
MPDMVQSESRPRQRASYEEILKGLTDALGFCSSLGLTNLAEKGRFSHYRRRIEQLIRIVRRGQELRNLTKRRSSSLTFRNTWLRCPKPSSLATSS